MKRKKTKSLVVVRERGRRSITLISSLRNNGWMLLRTVRKLICFGIIVVSNEHEIPTGTTGEIWIF